MKTLTSRNSYSVIPAKAEIQGILAGFYKHWIPAFTGMTMLLTACTNSPGDRVNIISGTYANPVVTSPQNCPDFSGYPAADWSNNLNSNYGCATVTNFGIQVADPNDLIAGKSSNLYNAARTSVAVGAYETGAASNNGPAPVPAPAGP